METAPMRGRDQRGGCAERTDTRSSVQPRNCSAANPTPGAAPGPDRGRLVRPEISGDSRLGLRYASPDAGSAHEDVSATSWGWPVNVGKRSWPAPQMEA